MNRITPAIFSCLILSIYAYPQDISFTTTKDIYKTGEKIKFINTSDNKYSEKTFIWNFGDDCSKNPAHINSDCDIIQQGLDNNYHIYNNPGKYKISLYIKDLNISFSKEITILSETNNEGYKNNDIVINGGFEDFSECPDNLGQIYLADNWYNATSGTSDYFNECFNSDNVYNWNMDVPSNFAGYAVPADSSSGYAGLIAYIVEDTASVIKPYSNSGYFNYREYIQQKLSENLVKDSTYIISFYTLLSSKSRVGARLGAYLSSEPVSSSNTDVIEAAPQVETSGITDTVNWTLISDTIKATGGEGYITIGNFKNDYSSGLADLYPGNIISSNYGSFKAIMSYYYIDNIDIRLLCKESIQRQAISSSGHSYKDDSLQVDYTIGQGIIATFSGNDIILTQGFQQPSDNDSTFNSVDKSIYSGSNGMQIRYYPNPCNNYVNILIENADGNNYNITVFNLLGKTLITKDISPIISQPVEINTSELASGIYYVKVIGNKANSAGFKLVKTK